MRINEEQFKTLWNIEKSWQSDPIKASDGSSENIKKYVRIFLRLEELGFIKIEFRDNQIYGAVATEKGKKIVEKKRI